MSVALLFLIHLFLQMSAWAQNLEPVEVQERHWRIGTGIQVQSLAFALSDRNTESATNSTDPDQVRYEPNVGGRTYFNIGYKEFSLFYAFSFSPEEETLAQKGKSKQNDYGFSYNTDSWVFDSYFKDYQGFYLESGNQTPTVRPDIDSKLIGVSIFHSHTADYSLKPLYSLQWTGEDSRWGYISGLNITHFNFSADSPVLARNGLINVTQNYISFSGGVSGYQHKNNYLWGGSTSLSLGPEYHDVEYQTTSRRKDSCLGYALGFHVDAAAAYRWSSIILGSRLKANILSTYVGDTGIQASGFDFDIFTTYYF